MGKMCENVKCHEYKLTQVGNPKFCAVCGVELVDKPHCQCGEEYSRIDNFCKECGRPTK